MTTNRVVCKATTIVVPLSGQTDTGSTIGNSGGGNYVDWVSEANLSIVGDFNVYPATFPTNPYYDNSNWALVDFTSNLLASTTRSVRLTALVRTSDSTALSSVIPDNATNIYIYPLPDYLDVSLANLSGGGAGNSYGIDYEARSAGAIIGSTKSLSSANVTTASGGTFSDGLYYEPTQLDISLGGTSYGIPVTLAQARAATFGMNFRVSLQGDNLDSTDSLGIHCLFVVKYDTPDGSARRQNFRLRDGRIAAVRIR